MPPRAASWVGEGRQEIEVRDVAPVHRQPVLVALPHLQLGGLIRLITDAADVQIEAIEKAMVRIDNGRIGSKKFGAFAQIDHAAIGVEAAADVGNDPFAEFDVAGEVWLNGRSRRGGGSLFGLGLTSRCGGRGRLRGSWRGELSRLRWGRAGHSSVALAPPAMWPAQTGTSARFSSLKIPVHVGSMNGHVAHSTVLKARAEQVVEGRWNLAQVRQVRRPKSGNRCGRRSTIGVALQANQAHFVTNQHAWIGRAVRLMTGHAAFEAHWRMFEHEGTTLIAVALEAGRLIAECNPHGLRHGAPVRIMTVGARHRAFGQAMLVRLLKRRPNRKMAGRALGVDVGCLSDQQRLAARTMDGMTLIAGHRVFGVAFLDASQTRGVAVAPQAGGVRIHWVQFSGQLDQARVCGICVFCPRTMARFASHPRPTARLICLHREVGRLSKSVVDFFVT